MTDTTLGFLLSIVIIGSCFSFMNFKDPYNCNYTRGYLVGCGIGLMMGWFELNNDDEEMEEMEKDKKTGDVQLLFFIAKNSDIFSNMQEFARDYSQVIDSLDSSLDINQAIQIFHEYMKKVAENGNGKQVDQLWNMLKEEDYEVEDWNTAMYNNEYFNYDCGFVEGIERMVEFIEKYADSQKEFILSIDRDDVSALYRRMVRFVKHGKEFVENVRDSDVDVVPNFVMV